MQRLIATTRNDILRVVNDQPLDWDLYGENSIEDAVDLIRRHPQFEYGQDFRPIFNEVLDTILNCK